MFRAAMEFRRFLCLQQDSILSGLVARIGEICLNWLALAVERKAAVGKECIMYHLQSFSSRQLPPLHA